uniref:C-type lectin domain-containing protein n=2 Tax=Macrostomum lignano TaxID=282301 RepID=A0A1I8G3D8_9PLAT
MWNASTFSSLSVTSGASDDAKHCIIATKSASALSYSVADCNVQQSTKVACGSPATFEAATSAARTFKEAAAVCKGVSKELPFSETDVTNVLTSDGSIWVNAFEYQPWNWSDGQSIFNEKSPIGDALAVQLLQSPNVRYNQEQCAYIQVDSTNNVATLSLVIDSCNMNESVVCQFNSTKCSGVPRYDYGYISGTVSNNQTDSSFSVDVLNGSCPMDLGTEFATQSAVFFSCINYNTTYVGNETTMVQSQCSMSGHGPDWSPIMNSNLCVSNFCDTRQVVDYSYPNNIVYLNASAADGSSLGNDKPYIENGTKMTLSCKPGARLVKVDDNFEKGNAISNEVTCLQSSWTYSVASFSNSTTIQVCDKTTSDTKLLKCEPIRCNTSDFKYLKSIDDRIGKLFLDQNEMLTVNCTTNASAVFNLHPSLNIKCILTGDYTYGYAISNVFMGTNVTQIWDNSNITLLDETIDAVCRSTEFLACPRNHTWLSESALEITSLSTSWPGYTSSSSAFPPNSTLTLRCIEPRVSDRLWTSIGETSTMWCPMTKADASLQWEGPSLSCNYETCPSPESLFPPMSMATGLKSNLSDAWIAYYNSSKFPPASQILINCSLDVSVFQILYCNDSGQWVPVQYSYVNDTLDLCIGSYINCSMATTPTPVPTTTLVVETTTETPTETTEDTTTVTSNATTVTVDLTSSTTPVTTTSTTESTTTTSTSTTATTTETTETTTTTTEATASTTENTTAAAGATTTTTATTSAAAGGTTTTTETTAAAAGGTTSTTETTAAAAGGTT